MWDTASRGVIWSSLSDTLKTKIENEHWIPTWLTPQKKRWRSTLGVWGMLLMCHGLKKLFESWMFCELYQCHSSALKSNRTFCWTPSRAWRFKGSESLFPNVKAVELFYPDSYSLNVWRLLDLRRYLRWPPNTRGVSFSDRLLQVLNYSFVLFARLSVRDWAEWLKTQWGKIFVMLQRSKSPVSLPWSLKEWKTTDTVHIVSVQFYNINCTYCNVNVDRPYSI